MNTQLRSPLKTVGGKAAAAERILAAFPPPHCYDRYIETFGGAGHVLFAKPAYGHEEVYNDSSHNLYIFWQQLKMNAEEMQRQLDDLLYERATYYQFHKSLFDGTKLTDLDRAIRFFYVLRSTGTGWIRLSPVGWNYRAESLHAFRSAVELFPLAKERLHYVAIDDRDCLATIKRYDSPRALFFCDPPYIGTEHYYEASRDGFDHEALAQALNHARSYVALSYYPHPLLDKLYPSDRWRRMTWSQKKSSALKVENGDVHTGTATELLLMNYSEQRGGLFDE
jgi:DNA adenine methylase